MKDDSPASGADGANGEPPESGSPGAARPQGLSIHDKPDRADAKPPGSGGEDAGREPRANQGAGPSAGPEGDRGAPAGGGPGAGPPDPHPLRRSRRRKVLAGVCGGLGRYFDIDPVIFRVVISVLAFGGLGALVYGLAWLFVPAQGEKLSEAQRLLTGRVETQTIAAVLVSLAGCLVFLSRLGSEDQAFPVLLAGAILAAIFWSQRGRRSDVSAAAHAAGDAPPAVRPPPAPSPSSWWREPAPPSARPYLWGPESGDDDEREAAAPGRPAAPRPKGAYLGFAVFWCAAIAAVIGGAAAWSSPLGTMLQIAFACALAVLGAGLVLGTWFGRVRGGTIFTAAVTTVLLVCAAALPKSIDHTWHERAWEPTSATSAPRAYALGTGRGELNLLRVDPRGATLRFRAEVGAGQLRVLVPDDVRVRLLAEAGAGAIQLPSDYRRDLDVSLGTQRSATLEPTVPGKERREGLLDLRLRVGFGQVEVLRAAP